MIEKRKETKETRNKNQESRFKIQDSRKKWLRDSVEDRKMKIEEELLK